MLDLAGEGAGGFVFFVVDGFRSVGPGNPRFSRRAMDESHRPMQVSQRRE